MESVYRETCRLCGSEELQDIISIGEQYVNDFPPSKEMKGRNGRCPLDVVYCKHCSLYQLRHTAPQELLYARHYWYKSSINNTIKQDLKNIVDVASEEIGLGSDDIFLDIGANDGTLLKNLKGSAIRVGCEPATNLHDELRENCEYIIDDFWTLENYKKLKLPKAKVISAIGMFYDMEDPNQFIKDAATVLSEGGLFIAQLMTLGPMLEQNDIGNICHEHLEFYTYKSLKYLFETNGFEIYKIEQNSINGGSYRIFARHYKNGSIDLQEDFEPEKLIKFKERLDRNRAQCIEYIDRLNKEGKQVYVYGASTKGNVILQYYGLTDRDIKGAAEKNEKKWGSFTLTDIPIVSEKEAREKADAFLVLPYGFIDEFVDREESWINGGGEFIVPLPEFRTISKRSLCDTQR